MKPATEATMAITMVVVLPRPEEGGEAVLLEFVGVTDGLERVVVGCLEGVDEVVDMGLDTDGVGEERGFTIDDEEGLTAATVEEGRIVGGLAMVAMA